MNYLQGLRNAIEYVEEHILDEIDFDELFEEKYKYYEEVQYPKVQEYVRTLKNSYYIFKV